MTLRAGARAKTGAGRTNVLFLGHSHLVGLVAAWRRVPLDRRPFVMEHAYLDDRLFQPNLGPDGALHPRLAHLISAPRLRAVVSVIGGNTHHHFGMCNHPEAWDVADPVGGAPADGTPILPRGAVARQMARIDAAHLRLLAALGAAAPVPVFHLAPPPPVASGAHLRAHPGHFADAIAAHGLAPRDRAARLWRLYTALYRTACADAGIAWLACPPEMLDPVGLLAAPGWSDDPTHPGPAYAAAVLAQLCRAPGLATATARC